MSYSLYGNFRQVKFSDVYEDAATFLTEYKASELYVTNNTITDTNATALYYLLYSRYGNSTIASSDTNRFKYNVYAIIFSYGPTWEKKLSVQSTLRSLTEADLLAGAKQINNHAYNPETTPTGGETGTPVELTYINEQNTTGYKKSKMEAYGTLMALLEKDVTEEFLNKFKKLFITFVEPEEALWYITGEGEEDDIE